MKKDQNFLEMVPKISEKLTLNKKDGVTTVTFERNAFIDKFFNFIFRKSAQIHVELDEIGTKVFDLIDGKRNIGEICSLLEQDLGEKVHPVLQRTTQFIASLKRNGFIEF